MSHQHGKSDEMQPSQRLSQAFIVPSQSKETEFRSASAYVGWTRGPLWGKGNLYTLRRSATGEWWVVDSEQLWIS